MATRPFDEHRLWSYSGEPIDWALSGGISLLVLSINYAPSYGIPFWMPLALVTLAAGLFIWRTQRRRPALERAGSPEEERRRLQKGVAIALTGLVVVGVVIAATVSGRVGIPFWVWLPAILAAGILFYLIAAALLRTVPSRFLRILLAALVGAGLLWVIRPDVGYINLFLLAYGVLALGMAFWLHLGRPKMAQR